MTVDLSFLIVILNFVLLLYILDKILYKPLKAYFTDRQKQIQNDVEEANKSIEKANLLIVEKENELKLAHTEARTIRDDVRKEAETQAANLIDTAKQQERDIVKQAQIQIQEMNFKAIAELENDLSEIVANFTSKVLYEKIDSQKDKELIKRILEKRGQ